MNYIMNMNKLKEKRNWISLRVHNRPTKEILYTMIFWFAKMTHDSHLAVGGGGGGGGPYNSHVNYVTL